jgi:hypothetical protein
VALVSGLRHYSFTDGPVLAETALRLAGKIGSRPGADVHRVVAALTRGFHTICACEKSCCANEEFSR